MQLIISSFIFDNNLFNNLDLKYKFLTFIDLKKKINKKYLNESKILFLYNQDDDIYEIKSLILNYNKYLELFLFNVDNFSTHPSSLFFFYEFIEKKININLLKKKIKTNNELIYSNIIFNKLINQNIIINGVCRNISDYIFNSFHKFIYLSFYFKKSKIIIYENDSNDNTLNLLFEYQELFNNINIIILTEKNINGLITQRISHARNYILDYIKINSLNPEYLITIDMDDILIDFKCNSILYPFNEKDYWSMFGGNSTVYYDMWALRTLKNPYKDFWDDKKKDNKYIVSIQKILESYFKISNDSNPIQVYSCFNGIGIYKYAHIINCKYNGDNTCEHVKFHSDMIKYHNAKLFIYPKLLVGPHKILGKPMDFHNIKKFVKNYL